MAMRLLSAPDELLKLSFSDPATISTSSVLSRVAEMGLMGIKYGSVFHTPWIWGILAVHVCAMPGRTKTLEPKSAKTMTSNVRRCVRAVDAMSDGAPKLLAIDDVPNHQVVPTLCLSKTDRPAYQALYPHAQVDVHALDLLRICLPICVLLCLHMPLVGLPTSGEIARKAKGLSQRFKRQKDGTLASSKHI